MPYTKIFELQELELADNASCSNRCIILTLDNVVQFCGDVELTDYQGGEAFATVPDAYRPGHDVRTTCAFLSGEMSALATVTLDPDGNLYSDLGGSGTLAMNGLQIGVFDRYYNDEIGNNYPQGTSPMVWPEV